MLAGNEFDLWSRVTLPPDNRLMLTEALYQHLKGLHSWLLMVLFTELLEEGKGFGIKRFQ